MNREELIEAARLAYVSQWEAENIRIGDTGNHNRSRAGIVAALAVFGEAWSHERTVNIPRAEWERLKRFEQAHTPTDDEREALSEFLFTVYEHGSQPNALREADAILSFLAARRTVQGEPSDAQVDAALFAYWGENVRAYGSRNGMRAALRAAAEAK